MENSNDTMKVIGALVLGTIVGVTLGILIAPDKGSKTRSKLINGATDFADNLKSKLSEEAIALRNKAEELEEMAMDKIGNVLGNVKQKTDSQKQ